MFHLLNKKVSFVVFHLFISRAYHGIVDPDEEGGNHTTELPVAFRLRTAYKLRGGKDLHLMIGLGKDVSVKFILGNPWSSGGLWTTLPPCTPLPGHEEIPISLQAA